MTLMASSMAPLHSLCQGNQNKLQHDFGKMKLFALVLASHDTYSIISSITAFVRSIWLKGDAWWCFCQTGLHWQHQCHMMPAASSVIPLHSLSHDDKNKMQYYFFGHVMPLTLELASCDADCIISGTNTLIRWRQSKCNATWPFKSCGAIGTGSGITRCQKHHQRQHCIHLVKVIKMRSNMTVLILSCH